MSSIASPVKALDERHISAAAQNIAAAQFALHGFDVLDQAGRARYSHDLGVASTGGMMKIMVHASLKGLWGLIDPYLVKTKPHKGDLHRAIDLWHDRYRHSACCLVQFDSSNLIGMPRIYLASAAEVAELLHEKAETSGEMARGSGAGGSGDSSGQEALPQRWRLSQARITELMKCLPLMS